MAKDFDPAEVVALLSIPALVTTNTPQMQEILSEAMARLHEINEGLRVAKQERANQPLTPDPTANVAAQASPAATDSDQIADDAKPSRPISAPESKVAAEAAKAPEQNDMFSEPSDKEQPVRRI